MTGYPSRVSIWICYCGIPAALRLPRSSRHRPSGCHIRPIMSASYFHTFLLPPFASRTPRVLGCVGKPTRPRVPQHRDHHARQRPMTPTTPPSPCRAEHSPAAGQWSAASSRATPSRERVDQAFALAPKDFLVGGIGEPSLASGLCFSLAGRFNVSSRIVDFARRPQ
jgi:hypothetical protein